MDLRQSIRRLLKEIGPGRMMNTAYDTAWIARLSQIGEPIGEKAVAWLRENQLADGSWGANTPKYYHDRVICTLAAMTILAKRGEIQDRMRLERARMALKTDIQGLRADPAGITIGFEMILPSLLTEAEALEIFAHQDNNLIRQLHLQREAKLAALPEGMINRFVTLAFSAEMAGPDGMRLLDVENLQEVNGSVGHSPSATAYLALYVDHRDPAALKYLHKTVTNGSAPNVAPFDVFEQAWALWNLSLTGYLDGELLDLCQPHLDFLQAAWTPKKGIGFAAGYTPKDSDVTSLVYEVLNSFGRSADFEALLQYEEETHFRCYELEANPSISANIHVLSALRRAGLGIEHPSVAKVLEFLFRAQALQLFWFDKWHASPYYTTAHAIIACAGYVDWLVDDAAYWVLETQNPDGSWGYYMPTAEETAYCLQALIIWKRQGHQVPQDVLKRGADWLTAHTEPPYPPLWIGKCLYCPELVVRSAILSALKLVEQEE